MYSGLTGLPLTRLFTEGPDAEHFQELVRRQGLEYLFEAQPELEFFVVIIIVVVVVIIIIRVDVRIRSR